MASTSGVAEAATRSFPRSIPRTLIHWPSMYCQGAYRLAPPTGTRSSYDAAGRAPPTSASLISRASDFRSVAAVREDYDADPVGREALDDRSKAQARHRRREKGPERARRMISRALAPRVRHTA